MSRAKLDFCGQNSSEKLVKKKKKTFKHRLNKEVTEVKRLNKAFIRF